MAIARQFATSVGVAATQIEGTEFPGFRLLNNGSNPVFIGDSNVTTATGYPIASTEEFIASELAQKSLRGKAGDRLYGVVAAATEDVRVLLEGRVNP